jgi:hypothetical protein
LVPQFAQNTAAGFAGSIFAPQLGQNFAPGCNFAPHLGQTPSLGASGCFVPQFGQNFAPSASSAPHFTHFAMLNDSFARYSGT